MPETTVISVRGMDPVGLGKMPEFVYVGRPVRGWAGSPFSNPFKIHEPHRSDITPEEAVARFAYWLEAGEHDMQSFATAMARRRAEILRRLPELLGKTLGCWCGEWKPGGPGLACHAVVLAKMVERSARCSP